MSVDLPLSKLALALTIASLPACSSEGGALPEGSGSGSALPAGGGGRIGGVGGVGGASGAGATSSGTGAATGLAGQPGSDAGGSGGSGAGTGPGRAGSTSGGRGPGGGAGLGAGGAPAGGAGSGTGGQGGGSAGTGGGGTTDGSLTDVTTFTPATCTTTPTIMPASKIPTVGVATFTTDLAGAERAIVQFGTSTTYTLEAPVAWAGMNHQTLLLGMPANTDVHYRVVVFAGNSACVGPDATFKTGAAPSGAPANQTPQKGTSSALPAPGFIIAENGSFAYIVNVTGQVVWAYKFPINLSRALMSWDGNYMYAREVGPFNAATGGAIYRVAMDGSGETKLAVSGGTHHDVVATPTGIAYPAKQMAGACDCIYTADADGSNSKCLVDLDVVFGKFATGPGAQAQEKCHVNAIRYYQDTDSFSVSDREKDAIAFISSKGEVLGSVGATPTGTTPNHAKAEGADSTTSSTWRVQHGHDQYAPNKLVLWSNGNFMGGTSKVLHYTINGATASLDWQYTGAGNSPTLSDAQHLPNGNFLVTNSQSGAVHEIDASAKLVQSFNALSKGYSQHRPTLYGPPPGR
jgi:arylsulfotransferase ASST